MYAGMTLVCQCKKGGLSLWYGCSIGWSHGKMLMLTYEQPHLAIPSHLYTATDADWYCLHQGAT